MEHHHCLQWVLVAFLQVPGHKQTHQKAPQAPLSFLVGLLPKDILKPLAGERFPYFSAEYLIFTPSWVQPCKTVSFHLGKAFNKRERDGFNIK